MAEIASNAHPKVRGEEAFSGGEEEKN